MKFQDAYLESYKSYKTKTKKKRAFNVIEFELNLCGHPVYQFTKNTRNAKNKIFV